METSVVQQLNVMNSAVTNLINCVTIYDSLIITRLKRFVSTQHQRIPGRNYPRDNF